MIRLLIFCCLILIPAIPFSAEPSATPVLARLCVDRHEQDSFEHWEALQASQSELIRSPFVLNSAINQPAIDRLELLRVIRDRSSGTTCVCLFRPT